MGEKQPIVGYTEDVSAGGFFVAVSHPLARGRRLRLELLADDQAYMVEGIVAHVRRVPQDLQKVKMSGMGISTLRLESFLRTVHASGTLSQTSGEWEMDGVSSPRVGPNGAAGLPDRPRPPASPSKKYLREDPYEGARRPPPRGELSPRAPSPRAEAAAKPTYLREDPHDRGKRSYLREDPHDRTPQPGAQDGLRRSGTTDGAPGLILGEPVPEPALEDSHDLVYPVRFETRDEFLRFFDSDLRMGVCLVRTSAPAPKGSRVTLALYPPMARVPTRFEAEVVRVQEVDRSTLVNGGDLPGMLVRFVEAGAVVAALGECVRQLQG